MTSSPALSVALHPPIPFSPKHLGFPHEPGAGAAGAEGGAGVVPVPASLAGGALSAGGVAGAGVEAEVEDAVESLPPEPAAFVAEGDRVDDAERPRWRVTPSAPPEHAVRRSAVPMTMVAKETRMFHFLQQALYRAAGGT